MQVDEDCSGKQTIEICEAAQETCTEVIVEVNKLESMYTK